MKKVITSDSTSSNSGRYLIQWWTYEDGDEFGEMIYNSEYCSSASKAIRRLDEISDEVSGLEWAGGLIDDMLMNETIYEITSEYTHYDNRRDD